MRLQQIDRTDPEKVFGIFYSLAGAAKDACVTLDLVTSVDGITILQPTAAALETFIGVVDATIAAKDYGLVQIYGYRSTSNVLTTNTSVAAGIPLIAVDGQDYFQSTSGHQFAVLLESKTSSSGTASYKIHIRAM